MRQFSMLLASAVCLAAMTGCGCGYVPKYASESEIKEYAKKTAHEEIELIGTVDWGNFGTVDGEDSIWKFRSKERDLEFEVWTDANSVNIDFGYTGTYLIQDNYWKKVNMYYNDTMTELLKKHKFLGEDETMFNYSNDRDDLMCCYKENSYPYPGEENYEYCGKFTFVFQNNTYDRDYRYVDAFLEDVRKEIVQKEYETTGIELDIRYEVYLKDTFGDKTVYYGMRGTNNDYTSSIKRNEEVNIHDTVKPCNNGGWENVGPAIDYGLLIEVKENKNISRYS